jgi:outer membrane protein OmpA-like peptidoglycan-associated protein
MRTRTALLLTLAFIWIAATQVHAQESTTQLELGVGAGGLLPVSETGEKPINLYANGYFIIPFSEMIKLELNGAYGQFYSKYYEGADVETDLIPLTARLRFYPFVKSPVLPYLYLGAGALMFNNKTRPSDEIIRSQGQPEFANEELTFEGTSVVFPIGLGLQFPVSENFTIDLNGGPDITLSDDLNPALDDIKDAYWHAMGGFTIRFGTSNADSDGDGLLNREEEELGTDPDNPDTDGDGLKDGEEVRTHKTNPLKPDTDGDGLTDGTEVLKTGTKPLITDTDGDGLLDGAEVNEHKTDPLKPDTDGDGLTDGEEVTIHKTNPLEKDTDRDGLEDGAEVKTHRSNPLMPDTDGDGLTDFDEVKSYRTLPNNPDTDGDGLKDGEEIRQYKTDPLVPDTDKGSVNDGPEVSRNTNPLDPSDDIPRLKVDVGKKLVLEGIVFATGSAEIMPESEEILMKAYNTLNSEPGIIVQIHGHTDNVGKRALNMKLSKARAESVRSWLVAKGISESRISTKGFGPDRPAASNKTEEGKQQNRRIEFYRVK